VTPLLRVSRLHKRFGDVSACEGVSLDLYAGEVLGIVGESGSGKTTLLNCIAGRISPDAGSIAYVNREGSALEVTVLPEFMRRRLMRSEWGYVQQNPLTALRMHVSAGANIAERLLEAGSRHYGHMRDEALQWLRNVEIADRWLDETPSVFSGGMQQRLQLARVLVTRPRLLLMDEPTGGLDVSVQARLLDLLRKLVRNLRLSVIIVTHDIGVVRLLADRLAVMRDGRVVEAGLVDQVLDDPHHPYTQLLVSATLTP
jgi:putative phosphonate transport system ATP-binding protein